MPAQRIKREIVYQGEKNGLVEWAKRFCIPPAVLHNRIYRSGWSVEDAFHTPLGATVGRYKRAPVPKAKQPGKPRHGEPWSFEALQRCYKGMP